MTLPASSSISSAQIAAEMGLTPGTQFIVPTNTAVLTGKASNVVWPTDFYSQKGISMHAAGPGEFEGSSGSTIDIQSNAQVGDLAILADMATGSSSAVVPSGWTSLGGTTGTGDGGIAIRLQCSYRILTAGQPGSTITGLNGATRNRKIMAIVRTVLPIAGLTASGWTHDVGGGAQSNKVLGGSLTPNGIIVGFALSQGNVSLNLSGGGTRTLEASNNTSATRALVLGYTKNDTPANATLSTSDGGDANGFSAGLIEFTF